MSDLMLHGVLNMPLPDDPAEMDIVTWAQFRARARQASVEIQRRTEALEGLVGPLWEEQWFGESNTQSPQIAHED